MEVGTLAAEVARRRTFAIISHPDAGKTTLTEKLLLYCGQIRTAGEVKAKSQKSKTTSDWMELEKQRGISVSTSVMQFEYENLKINLLDTPGHKDFGEDTYRTLMAADIAVMLMDGAKGVEAQTKKLFEICRMRGLPIMTFVNKMDRDALESLQLLEETEKVLGISAVPLNWPIGMGQEFKGVYDRISEEFIFFTKSLEPGKHAQEDIVPGDWEHPKLKEYLTDEESEKLKEDLELLEGVLGKPDRDSFLNGEQTPTLFGSARNNFGITSLLRHFKHFAPAPQKKEAEPEAVDPNSENFSAFVFKIQANMDKSHRDRMAFLRICSGAMERDMDVFNERLGKKIRLAHAKQFWAQSRETVDVAFAGDIVGVHDPGNFHIGDSLYVKKKLRFQGIPRFSPECFAKLELRDPLKRKQLQKGIKELTEEGLVQAFVDPKVGWQDPILGVVGVLQFDVLMFRLKDEYKVEARLNRLPYALARWLKAVDDSKKIEDLGLRTKCYHDQQEQNVMLFKSQWEYEFTQKEAGEKLDWFLTSDMR